MTKRNYLKFVTYLPECLHVQFERARRERDCVASLALYHAILIRIGHTYTFVLGLFPVKAYMAASGYETELESRLILGEKRVITPWKVLKREFR